MKDKKTRAVTGEIWAELLIIRDKKRSITEPRPTCYIVQLHVKTGKNHLIVKEESTISEQMGLELYEQYKQWAE